MNKHMILPLATLMVALSFTGCRSDDTTTTSDPTTADDGVVEGQTATPPGEDILGDGVVPDYSLDGTVQNDLTHMEDDVRDDLSHAEGDMTLGIPFDDMVENGQVHDTDGILTDGENAKHDDFIRYE